MAKNKKSDGKSTDKEIFLKFVDESWKYFTIGESLQAAGLTQEKMQQMINKDDNYQELFDCAKARVEHCILMASCDGKIPPKKAYEYLAELYKDAPEKLAPWAELEYAEEG